MISKYKILFLKILYIFFTFLSLILFFFSTAKAQGKAFDINKVEVSRPFNLNFDKNKVIDEGFNKAFLELILLITNSNDQKKINQIKLNEIKGMIDSFTITEEKFINEIYYVNLGVSFNKKEIFKFLEKKNIFPSTPVKNKFLFIPIIIDENKKELLIFNDNKIFVNWNKDVKSTDLVEYILPTQDLEDLNLIKDKYENIERYDFKDITSKYYLKDSIITLIFKNEKKVRILSRITVNDKVILKNQSFLNINIENDENSVDLINDLKIIYEDYWKNLNQINTSIKLPLSIKVNNLNNNQIMKFEKTLTKADLVYNFFISKIDKDFVYYKVIFNGTPNVFLKKMTLMDYNFDTQNSTWILK